MSEAQTNFAFAAIEMHGNRVPHGAIHCTGIHVRAARGIWPRKTAENWAKEAGVKVRIVRYWIAGREVSDSGKLALIRLLQ